MPLRPRKVVDGFTIPAHGGVRQLPYAEFKALGIDPDDILDFSVCTNPFMPPPGIKEMMSTIRIEQYPDSQSGELCRALSAYLGVPAENILAGSGTTELIRLIALAYFRRSDRVLILEPTYGEYEAACRLSGARVLKHRSLEKDDFSPRREEIIELVNKYRPRAVFICNPNNPTGKYLSRQDITVVLDGLKESLLVLDEAYVAFTKPSWNSLDLIQRGNVIVLRSMTKDYGLPGLRLGYAVACHEIIDCLRSVLPPWNVNAISQKVGVAVLQQDEYLNQSLRQVREAQRLLADGLNRLGFKVLPSDAHYFLVKVGQAAQCRRSLLKKGILVRDCTSFGLPEYIRISPRTMPECVKFIEAFEVISRAGGNMA